MLFVKAQKRRRIAEGQVVTYNIKGRLLKYKKVAGVMKYVGVAAAVERKKTVKEKVVGVPKINKEQKQILDSTGILCKDTRSLKYVSDEMASIFKASTIKIDYSKLPGYIKWIYHPSMGSSSKYTTNKIGLKLGEIIEMEKKYGVKMFTGMPKEMKDVIEPYRKILLKQYAKDENVRALRKESKKLDNVVSRSRNAIHNVRKEIYDKYYNKTLKKVAKQRGYTVDNYKDFDSAKVSMMPQVDRAEIVDSIPIVLKRYSALISDEGYMLDYWSDDNTDNIKIIKEAKGITAVEKKQLIDAFNVQTEPMKKSKDFMKRNKNIMSDIGNIKLDVVKKLKRDITSTQKDNPKSKKWFEALYTAYYTNKILLPKMRKNSKLINAKEAYGVDDAEELRKLFIEKRSQAYKGESAKKKLLSALSEQGEERKTFSLSNASSKEQKKVYDKMKSTFDKDEHGSFGFKIHNIFKIDDTSYYKDYKKVEKDIGNVTFSYHGTAFKNAAKIARGGFKVTKPEVGRMIGDGIYGSSNSSKSLQYVGKGFSRQIGTRGVLFVCKNALGQKKTLFQDYDISRQSGNEFLQDYDTVYAPKGVGGLRNIEWVSKNPKQFLPVYWIDVELAKPGTYEEVS